MAYKPTGNVEKDLEPTNKPLDVGWRRWSVAVFVVLWHKLKRPGKWAKSVAESAFGRVRRKHFENTCEMR